MLTKTCTAIVAAVLALGTTVHVHAAGGPSCVNAYEDCSWGADSYRCCPNNYYCQPWSPTDLKCIPTFDRCPYQRTNIDYQGDDLGTADVSQPGDCCKACADRPDCVAYTYVNGQNGKPGCYLKKAMTNPVKKLGAVSGEVDRATNCKQTFANTDFNGADIEHVDKIPLGDCCYRCNLDPRCQTFSWDGSTCYLKSGEGNKQSKNGVTSGYADRYTPDPNTNTNPSQCPTTMNNTDLYGDDIQGKQFQGISLGDCCDKCKNEAACVAFAFDGTCYLKSGQGQKQSKNGVTSGYMNKVGPPIQGTCMDPMIGVDLYGDDLKKFTSDQGSVQASDCCAKCAQESGCVAFTLADNTCYLKKGMGKRQSKNGVTSGIVIPAHCVNPLANTDYNGADLRNFGGTDLGSCCDACAKDNNCKAYTFWDGTCYLKSGQGSVQKKDGAISGVKSSHKVYHFRILG